MDPYRLKAPGTPGPLPKAPIQENRKIVMLRDDAVRIPPSAGGTPAWERAAFGPMKGQPSKATDRRPMLRRPAFWVFGPFLFLFALGFFRAILGILRSFF